MVFGEHREGLGCFWCRSMVLGEFLSGLGVILFLFGLFLTCFGVSVCFRWVLVGRKHKWEGIVGFGEDQVSFGWFSSEFLSFCCFFFWCSSCLGCFWRVLRSPLGFVGFSLVVKVKGSWLWVLGKIRWVSDRFRGNFLVSVFFSSDSVLVWGVCDVFWGLRCVLVGFLLVTMVKKCKLWVLEKIRWVSGGFRGNFLVSVLFLLMQFLIGVFLTCFGVSVVF